MSATTAAATENAATVVRPAWAEIDLDALAANLRLLRQRVGSAAILAVVKADAYGPGAVAVARTLERHGVDWLGVALVEEGAKLRRAGVGLPILVLGAIQSAEIDEARAQRLTPAVSSLDQLRMWAAAGDARNPESVPQNIHLKVDTGMHRLGIAQAEWSAAAEILAASPSLRLEGLLSHLAEAEATEGDFTALQERRFDEALALFRAPIHHLANSAAALHRPTTRRSLVRAGLALYGIDPARREQTLAGVMSVKARLVQVREIDVGEHVGYGARSGYGDTWVAQRRSRIGVVPLGYADGYPWRLSNRARAWIDGTFVPVIGAVNMDLVTLDLTGIDVPVGGTVTLLSGSAERGPTAVELAERAGTTPYEILCHFGLRLPKLYVGG